MITIISFPILRLSKTEGKCRSNTTGIVIRISDNAATVAFILFKTKVAIFVFLCRILYRLGTRCVEEKSSSYLFLSTLHRALSSGDQQIAGRDLADCVQDLMGMKLEVLVFVQHTGSCHAQIMGQVPAKRRRNVKIMFSSETKPTPKSCDQNQIQFAPFVKGCFEDLLSVMLIRFEPVLAQLGRFPVLLPPLLF